MEHSWAAAGVDCICIRNHPWENSYLGGLMYTPIAGPKFMQQYKIDHITYLADDHSGHRVKLYFKEFYGAVQFYCICGFRPLEKIEDKEHRDTTAPVDAAKV